MVVGNQRKNSSVHKHYSNVGSSRTPTVSPMKMFNKPVSPIKDPNAVFIEAIEDHIE